MRYNLIASAIVAASISGAVADLCASGSNEENGNWYCQAVEKIVYSNLGVSGSYKKVTNMYPSCEQSTYDFSGNLAPFDEEVSMHFRGPLVLKQAAVYTPSGSATKTKARRGTHHERRHGHAGFHKRNKEIREIQDRAEEEKRQIGAIVTATIDGKVVHWVNQYGGPGGASPATPAPSSTPDASSSSDSAGGFIANAASSVKNAISAAAAQPTESSSASSVPAAAGDWSRVAYYNSDSKTSDGMVFLNNMGGQGSGVFDDQYGNSLSYASSDSQSGASSAQVSNGNLASNQEFIIFSDKECDGDCGYVRNGTVAYHGFDGPNKAFYFEFSMPDDGNTGFNGNMPAGWFLNAQIPRTAQYSSCSSWPNSGEFDWCEVLDSGNSKCKSTWHGTNAGGSSDYFDRPTGAPIKMAVVMTNDQINVQVLDSSTDFGSSMAQSAINSISSSNDESDGKKLLTSLFALGS